MTQNFKFNPKIWSINIFKPKAYTQLTFSAQKRNLRLAIFRESSARTQHPQHPKNTEYTMRQAFARKFPFIFVQSGIQRVCDDPVFMKTTIGLARIGINIVWGAAERLLRTSFCEAFPRAIYLHIYGNTCSHVYSMRVGDFVIDLSSGRVMFVFFFLKKSALNRSWVVRSFSCVNICF